VPGEPLFDSRIRADPSYKRAAESTYEFLDRVSRPELAAPRAVLNDWVAHWPADDREELMGRFRAKDELQFAGAFWELYLHEAHRKLGYSASRDPELPDSPHRPDFLMCNGADSFYLEATVVGHSTAELSRRRRERAVIELIDQARHPDFLVMIKTIGLGQQQPSRSAVVRAVESWLNSLDWEAERQHTADLNRAPDHIEAAGSHLFLRPWPKEPEARGQPTSFTVITGPSSGGMLNEPPMIRSDLKSKARKYGRPDRPFVVAILIARDFASDHDIEQALYGPEVVTVPVGEHAMIEHARLSRDPDGLWQRGSSQRATRVSAVLSAVQLHAWSIATSALRLWLNPWAGQPLDATTLPWATVAGDLEANVLIRAEASRDPHEIFGLPRTWPAG
jgi:hypothetical protein